MREPIKTVIILIFGWSMIVLGVIGLFLPVLQGILFILIGLYILGKRSRMARKLVQRLNRRYPGLALSIREARYKGEDLIKRCSDFFKKSKSR